MSFRKLILNEKVNRLMANNYYQLYIDSVFNLAYTISVKFEQAAQAINNKVMMEHGFDTVNLEDPYTWRYYQNISGAYHFTNSNIEVISLDTLQTIPFTKAVLLNHPATLDAYNYNSIYYNNLIDKYPEDELLIKGILYPCDIDAAIQAKDGTILSYPADLVETNEYSFISKLQEWIYDYLHRWVNKQYTIAHDLYVPMYMSQFYMHLIPAIINIRLSACKTNEAHSFHIRQRLASNQYLDKYWNYLTREQALFFYRNIDYIQANAGKQEVFDWLVENVMTKRGLPIYGFDARHDLYNIENDQTGTIQRPDVIFRRLPINYPTIDPKRNIYSTSEMLDKINVLAPGNASHHDLYKEDINNKLIDAKSNNILTKLLESAITDYSQAVPYPLADSLLNEWISMAYSNRYDVYITVEFPISKESTTLTAKNAFILFTYCMLKYRGIDTANVNNIIASRVYKQTLPTFAWMKNYFKNSTLTDILLNRVFSNAPETTPVTSVNEFYRRVMDIYKLNLHHYYSESKQEHYITTGELKVANTQLFEDKTIYPLPENVTYQQWLTSFSYELDDYSQQEYLDLATVIYSRATGAYYNNVMGIKEIQRAMINLFKDLSSYSIEIVDNASSSPLMLVSDPGVKFGDAFEITSASEFVEVPNVTVIDVFSIDMENVSIDSDDLYPDDLIQSAEIDYVEIDSSNDPTIKTVEDSLDFIFVELSPLQLTGADFESDYNLLTPEQKELLFNLSIAT